jgi:hypothetical protein
VAPPILPTSTPTTTRWPSSPTGRGHAVKLPILHAGGHRSTLCVMSAPDGQPYDQAYLLTAALDGAAAPPRLHAAADNTLEAQHDPHTDSDAHARPVTRTPTRTRHATECAR